ncbi:glycoside hydrolase family 125 protein [Caproiciproducens galactitolivorans]|uniref:Glycoside hydrolase family 125 protein n=1 Tax=Caproiciproducens galactitolivorans TaxID=642589 RepID=A0ABT4BTZ4_9FIRM|nr:glycoside hydrolase family 125 protein [Caproiciproducens galactitolivorans]MCY1714377.1 glycoside hydrolase family 125 protein [Caproiciproducens galactitolivorans]
MNAAWIPTGNQMVSLPQIKEQTAGIHDLTFLHMGYKGLIDVRGDEDVPLILPFIKIGDTQVLREAPVWNRLGNWIPRFSFSSQGISLNGVILAPVEERGFLVRLEATNSTPEPVQISYGLRGRWATSWHCVNEDKMLDGEKHCYRSAWNNGIVFDLRCGAPLFAFAPMTDKDCEVTFTQHEKGVDYCLTREETLAPGQSCELVVYWGIGFEEVAAATSAKEMLRQGYDFEFNRTLNWLSERSLEFKDKNLTRLYNTNLFFCIFFSTGITLDTEELVLVTSRSPRYYVSAAYWDRDSLLWSFPAVLDADHDLAREMLTYVFGRQGKNFGIHSRFIDGTVLEPGFELDELMAPVLALERYTDATGDDSILEEASVKTGIKRILHQLEKHRHPTVALYDTFLQPTDDEHVYPYITYDNVLVWKALLALAHLYPAYHELEQTALNIRSAIERHCVKEKDGKPFYAWSVDLNGQYDIYDEPPGSLQILPYLGFCRPDEDVYRNTVQMIRSPGYRYSFASSRFAEIGCPHAPHPWILSVANSLLCGRTASSAKFLHDVQMDHLIACESVDENTGECTTGAAFATCAGFLCHAMKETKEELDRAYEE